MHARERVEQPRVEHWWRGPQHVCSAHCRTVAERLFTHACLQFSGVTGTRGTGPIALVCSELPQYIRWQTSATTCTKSPLPVVVLSGCTPPSVLRDRLLLGWNVLRLLTDRR